MVYARLTDRETGEILIDKFIIDTLEDKKRRMKFSKKKALKNSFKALQNEYIGKFVFFIYRNMNELCKILTDIELVRYIYLGTYVKNDGFLKEDNNKSIIDKKKMKELLQMQDRTLFNKYFYKLIDNELIYIENNSIKINISYFYSGYEKDYKKLTGIDLDEDFTRIYIDATRSLYTNTESRKKKQLSIVYKLLPYTNWKYNILCYNPREVNKDKIKLFTIGDVIDSLGYDRSHISRFKKDFYTIPCEGSMAFLSIQQQPEYLNSMVAVNPLVYYKGNDSKELTYLITLFGIRNSS